MIEPRQMNSAPPTRGVPLKYLAACPEARRGETPLTAQTGGSLGIPFMEDSGTPHVSHSSRWSAFGERD